MWTFIFPIRGVYFMFGDNRLMKDKSSVVLV